MNPERILRQQLEDLQRAGVTLVPAELTRLVAALASIPEAPVPEAPVPEAPVGQATREEATSPQHAAAARQADTPVESTVAGSPVMPIPAAEVSSSAPATSPVSISPPKEHTIVKKSACSPLSRDERESQLASLADRVAACQKCQELAATRTRTVFGVGNPEARILFVGEAPGADEDQQGEPFVGRAGRLLNDIIGAIKLTREEIYICNILRCRPPGNRNPLPVEADNCREFLDGQIETVAPEYIVCWGSVAAKNLLAMDMAIGKMRGRFYEYAGAKVLCTYHPSYLLRNPSAKAEVWKDMKFLMQDMGVELE